jgi:hypothetical protein
MRAIALTGFILSTAWGQPQGGEFTIAGTVVNSVTGEPVKRALVVVDGKHEKSLLSDASGAFRVSGLAGGGYGVFVTKPGFARGNSDGEISLGPSREDLKIALTPYALIRGTVVDSRGELLANVRVEALRSQVKEGQRTIAVAGSGTTDDRGQYLIANLEHGLYFVRAAGRQRVSIHLSDRPPAFTVWEAFVPTYFGGSHTSATAMLAPLEAGGELRADFALTLEPAHAIRGAIKNFRPPARLQAFREGEDVAANQISLGYGAGRFDIHDVTDGSYRVRVTIETPGEAPRRAEQAVRVAGGDVTGVTLVPTSGVVVKGTVRREGEFQRPEVPTPVSVRLVPLDEPSRQGLPREYTAIAKGDAFQIPEVLQGRYRIEFQVLGLGYVSAATLGDADLLARPELQIDVEPPPALELVVRGDVGSLQVVMNTDKLQCGRVLALLVPERSARTHDVRAQVLTQHQVGFGRLPPGNYRVHAFPADAEIEYANPEVLRILSGQGEPVSIEPNAVARVEVQRLSEAPK